jgi:hypothetical protein
VNVLARNVVADPFAGLPRGHFGAILADPPWRFGTWDKQTAVKARERKSRMGTVISASVHYDTMESSDIKSLPIGDLAAKDCVLFLWACWPNLKDAFDVLDVWGFNLQNVRLFMDEGRPLSLVRRRQDSILWNGLLDASKYRAMSTRHAWQAKAPICRCATSGS